MGKEILPEDLVPGTTPALVEGDTNMANLLLQVAAFHIAVDFPIHPAPITPSAERRLLRRSLQIEETQELIAAIDANDTIEIADALADIIYVSLGTALEYGISLDRVWEEVRDTNNAKIDQETGKVNRRADGKILKPEGWKPPRIKEAIYGGLYPDDDVSAADEDEGTGDDAASR